MGERIFKILVLDGTNEYILGRISGILIGLSDHGQSAKDLSFAQIGVKDNPSQRILRVRTTRGKYRKAAMLIEKRYPGLCIFE